MDCEDINTHLSSSMSATFNMHHSTDCQYNLNPDQGVNEII